MLAVAVVLAVGACARGTRASSPDVSRVPAEFRAACGQPGATVTVASVPVTVRHIDCDLTAVKIVYGLAGVTVPAPGNGTAGSVDTFVATDQPTHVEVSVDAKTLDVTVRG